MKNEFIENYLFEMYKNNCFRNSGEFKDLVDKYKIKASDLYRKIQNYQIQKYGITLNDTYGVTIKQRNKTIGGCKCKNMR